MASNGECGRGRESAKQAHEVAELGADAVRCLIDEWIIGKTNAYRDRYILKRRLIDGVPYCILTEMVEAEFHQPLTERQLRRIVAAGIKTLKRHGL